MGLATSLYAIGDALDPSLAYWSVTLTTGKTWSERQLVTTFKSGQKGVRKLDWTEDLVATGDIYKIKELTLHCPDGRTAVLETMHLSAASTTYYPPFQFKTKSLNMLGADSTDMEFQVIGRVLDKASGRCECFIWDYRPEPGQNQLIAYKTNIFRFGSWRPSLVPIGALGLDVQGFRL